MIWWRCHVGWWRSSHVQPHNVMWWTGWSYCHVMMISSYYPLISYHIMIMIISYHIITYHITRIFRTYILLGPSFHLYMMFFSYTYHINTDPQHSTNIYLYWYVFWHTCIHVYHILEWYSPYARNTPSSTQFYIQINTYTDTIRTIWWQWTYQYASTDRWLFRRIGELNVSCVCVCAVRFIILSWRVPFIYFSIVLW